MRFYLVDLIQSGELRHLINRLKNQKRR
jgi:hypothetical protein